MSFGLPLSSGTTRKIIRLTTYARSQCRCSHRPERAPAALEKTLKDLQIDYLDLVSHPHSHTVTCTNNYCIVPRPLACGDAARRDSHSQGRARSSPR